MVAGILLILLPNVVYGGTSLLSLLISDAGYAENQLRQDLWRADHAHAGVLLVLSLVTLRYVDEAALSGTMRRLVRHSILASAVLLSAAFFLSVLSPDATQPNALIYLAYAEAVSLAVGLLVLGAGLIRGAGAPLNLDGGIDDSRHHSLLRSCISRIIHWQPGIQRRFSSMTPVISGRCTARGPSAPRLPTRSD